MGKWISEWSAFERKDTRKRERSYSSVSRAEALAKVIAKRDKQLDDYLAQPILTPELIRTPSTLTFTAVPAARFRPARYRLAKCSLCKRKAKVTPGLLNPALVCDSCRYDTVEQSGEMHGNFMPRHGWKG